MSPRTTRRHIDEVLTDPYTMDQFASPEPDAISDEERYLAELEYEHLGQLMDLLPDIERDVLELLADGIPYEVVGTIVDVHLTEVPKHRDRGIARLRWLHQSGYVRLAHRIVPELSEVLGPKDLELALTLYRVCSARATGRELNIHYATVTYQIKRLIKHLSTSDHGRPYAHLFTQILAQPEMRSKRKPKK